MPEQQSGWTDPVDPAALVPAMKVFQKAFNALEGESFTPSQRLYETLRALPADVVWPLARAAREFVEASIAAHGFTHEGSTADLTTSHGWASPRATDHYLARKKTDDA